MAVFSLLPCMNGNLNRHHRNFFQVHALFKHMICSSPGFLQVHALFKSILCSSPRLVEVHAYSSPRRTNGRTKEKRPRQKSLWAKGPQIFWARPLARMQRETETVAKRKRSRKKILSGIFILVRYLLVRYLCGTGE